LCSLHAGLNFTDEQLHNTGVAWRDEKLQDDGGGRGDFKTPTLRRISRTAPYMHDGSLPTLESVVDYYDRGGNKNPQLDLELRPLHLSHEEKRNLVSFLRSLGPATAKNAHRRTVQALSNESGCVPGIRE
jgi:cytochrome c peroxidase